MKTVLVIKLSALGDMVQATPAFDLIKKRHPHDRLVLLTSYVDFARNLGIFDEVIKDPRKRGIRLLPFLKDLYQLKPDVTYDLQSVDRTHLYRFVLSGKKHHLKPWKHLHSQDRLRRLFQLETWPELDLKNQAEPIDLPSVPYGLVIPGASVRHPGKRWDGFEDLCQIMIQKNLLPVIIGGEEEFFPDLPGILNLCGKTSVFHIVTLAKYSRFAVGNDTGPMFLASAGGCPTLALHGPLNPFERGGHKGIRHKTLSFPIPVDEVWRELEDILEVENQDLSTF